MSKLTLRGDMFSGEGWVGNIDKWRQLPALLRNDLLSDWIGELETIKEETEKDLILTFEWLRFRGQNDLTGLAKVFVEKSELLSVSNNMLTLEIPIRPLAVAISTVKEKFKKFANVDVSMMVRVSPNTQS